MRHFRTLLISSLIAASLIAGTVGVASAASDNRNGYSFELYEDMCLEDGSILLCFKVHGRFTVVNQDGGDQIGTGSARTISYIVEGGQVTSASIDHSTWQTKVVDGVFQTELTITQSRSLTPGQQCVAHAVLKIEDGQVVIDHASMSCT